VLVLDSGDLFFEKEIPETLRASAKLKAEAVARIYRTIGCDAVNVGERDLLLGVTALKELEKKFGTPFISANLTDTKNTPLFKQYVIKQIAGKTIGIFGLTGDTEEMTSIIGKITQGSVVVQDSIKAAESVMKELAGKVDLVIALTHQGVGRDWVLARRVGGIDLIIGGRDGQKIREPRKAGTTQIVQAGEKGQYLGLLEVSFGPDKTKAVRNSLIPLGNQLADDEVTSMILDYQKQMAALYVPAGESPASPASTSCSPCHEKEFSSWQATGHARAYESLVNRNRQFDPECLACHTTRFEEPDGFSMKLQQKGLLGVQCESCHGNASEHVRASTAVTHQKPGKEVCTTCHTPDRSPTFEKGYEVYFRKAKH